MGLQKIVLLHGMAWQRHVSSSCGSIWKPLSLIPMFFGSCIWWILAFDCFDTSSCCSPFQRALKAPAQAMLMLLVFPSNNPRSWLVILTPGVGKLNGMWAPNMKLPQVTTELSQYQWHPMVLIASKVSLFIVAVQFCIHKMQQLSSLHPNLSGFLLRKPLYSAGGSDIEKGLSRFQRKASTQPVLADRSPNGCHTVPLPIMAHLLLFPNSWSLSFHKRLSNLETRDLNKLTSRKKHAISCHAKFMNSTAFITYFLWNVHFSKGQHTLIYIYIYIYVHLWLFATLSYLTFPFSQVFPEFQHLSQPHLWDLHLTNPKAPQRDWRPVSKTAQAPAASAAMVE